MRKLLSRRPSASMIVAIIAVILAVGGTATAALNKKDKKKVRSIADSEITKLAPGLSVANAANASNAANAAKAANSDALGGVGPGGYTQGAGHNYFGANTGDNPSTGNALLNIPGVANITFNCAANGIDSTLVITNTSGSFLGDVGQNQDSNSADLDPFGPNISNGASVSISHTGAGNTVADTTFQLWNDQNGKVASVHVSNVFCFYGASASTNQ
jgi:hypothetical protein